MQNRCFRFSLFLVAVGLVLSLSLLDATAQTSKRRSRRTTKPVVTNPPIAPATGAEDQTSGGDAKIISTADENPEDQEPGETRRSTKKTTVSEQDQMQRTINSLSNQVERLNDKLSQMQEDDKTLIDMERLTRAEQRAENLRSQLVDVESKLADLQSKVEQLDYSLKPENIERVTSGYGTVHPEEARDSRRRQLESEKNRTLSQIRILETSRSRLEASLVTADAEVDRLRRRLEMREQQESANPSSDESESKPGTPKRPE